MIYHFVVSMVYAIDCLNFLSMDAESEEFEFVHRMTHKDFTNDQLMASHMTGDWLEGVSGICYHDQHLFMASGRGSGGNIYVTRLLPLRQNIGYRLAKKAFLPNMAGNAHDLTFFKEDEYCIFFLVVDTQHDCIKMISFDKQTKAYVNTEVFVQLQDVCQEDTHHFNSLHVDGTEIYVTSAHRNADNDKCSDVLVVDAHTRDMHWMDLKRPNGTQYQMAHNFHKLCYSGDDYVICDSYNGRFCKYSNGMYQEIYLDGWTRGLCVLDNGDFLVGVSPFKENVSTQSSFSLPLIVHLDADLHIKHRTAIAVLSSKAHIYDIKMIGQND